MSLQPITQLRKPIWRGCTSSGDMNKNFEEILYDLNTLFEEASSLVVKLNEMESVIRHTANGINARVNAVDGLITSYEAYASGYKMLHEDFYLTENITYPDTLLDEEKCIVNTGFGTVTLPVNNSFSKVYTINLSDGKIYQAADLSAIVTVLYEDGNVDIDTTNPSKAFDGETDSTWERKVKFDRDDAVTSISCRLDVGLPSMNNPNINKLFIKPYPEGTVDITAITYDTLTSQENSLSSFPDEGENGIKSTMYSFNDIQPVRFHFYLRQRTNQIEDNYKTFVYGAREIGIEKVEYQSSGKIAVKFMLPSTEDGLFSAITSLRTSPEYDNSMYKLYLYISQENFDNNIPIWTSANNPITTTNQLDISLYTTDSIWVMLEMTQEEDNSSSPLFDSITITYITT